MGSLNILHIAQDEKFINAARILFEKAFPGSNDFLIVKPPANPPLKYIKPWESLRTIVQSNDIVEKLAKECESADIVVLHGIDKLMGALILQTSRRDKFFGIIYGAELYNEEIIGNRFLGAKSAGLENKLQQEKTIRDLAKKMYRMVRYRNINKEYDNNVEMKGVFSAIKVYGAFYEKSYSKWVESGILAPDHQTIPFSYYPLDYIVKDPALRAAGEDILLGNSASATNNHLEALDFLKKLDLGNRKIVTPLSYGDSRYAKEIIKIYRKELKVNFEPITEFMPIDCYNKLLSRCGIVIMNHYRAQGVGNLVASLYMGAKVYVNDTDAYRFFKQIGCYIFLIDDHLLSNEDDIFTALDEKKVLENRRVLENHLSERVLVQYLKEGLMKHFLKQPEEEPTIGRQ